jgi:hypothetical protein
MLTTAFGVEHLTKLDVAERELRAAICLLFDDGDPVAVHTLAASALGILEDLAEHRGMETLWTLRKSPYIREGKRKLWITALHEAQNYFKHAHRDPDALLEFNIELPRLFILNALLLYTQVTQTLKPWPEAVVYLLWFSVKYPEVMEEDASQAGGPFWVGLGFNADDFGPLRALLAYCRAAGVG